MRLTTGNDIRFNQAYVCNGCGKEFLKPSPLLFSFNNPYGACPECNGFGNKLDYSEKLIVPHPTLSIGKGAIEPWTKPSLKSWHSKLLNFCKAEGISTTKPYKELSPESRQKILHGHGRFAGVFGFFAQAEHKKYKLHVRVFLRRYQLPFPCKTCRNTRLRPEALCVHVGGKTIAEISDLPVDECTRWFGTLKLSKAEKEMSSELVKQITMRLEFLCRVGLSYLTLSRLSKTLSGGESQRINLANQLGGKLSGTLYVLDEPSIGLHARDKNRLIEALEEMVSNGNSVVVVEHDNDIIQTAQHIIEMGPYSGEQGGEIMYNGPFRKFLKSADTLTAEYLRGEREIPVPSERRPQRSAMLTLEGATENNLKDVTLTIPLKKLVCITGVSGSGKSTLIHTTLYGALARVFNVETVKIGAFKKIHGLERVKGVSMLDQRPIGKSPRSNPITYMKGFDDIRKIFADTPKARRLGLTTRHFSFNVDGGRCDTCRGDGIIRTDMYFLTDLFFVCDDCEGKRFQKRVLGVKYKGLNIHDVLNMTVNDAREFFAHHKRLQEKLNWLVEVGLGYIKLGQPAPTLSGGESQRLKIAAELSSSSARDMIYFLDEPTTGLHTNEVARLIEVINQLVDMGNTVVVIEHNYDVIKSADYIVDMGPEGGDRGGRVVVAGTPEEVAVHPRSHTGRFLKLALLKKAAKGSTRQGKTAEEIRKERALLIRSRAARLRR